MKLIAHCTFAVCAAALFTQGSARASDPIGAYALIDKIVFEPSADAPERVQIFGVFALPVANNPNNYQAPQRGYLYFMFPAGKETLARKEWADFKEIAGKHQVVAFGNRWELHAHVRKIDEKPTSPDAYVISMGVVKVRTDTDYAPVKSLLDFARQ